ncbi:hypothetical protein KIM372_01950 [Bombiscardovia nodaiensis]|uniref:Uncharacterized protein n=1 Tax=Bombiscardovia nodaiensis TaxID=2932181 RepID=A0ABM8B637_9BIFI|nr:hypothetical protein KIM372_01950 [Bombiscardovia nodaiensis]
MVTATVEFLQDKNSTRFDFRRGAGMSIVKLSAWSGIYAHIFGRG